MIQPPYCSYVHWEPPPWWPKHHAKQLLLEYHQAQLPLPPTWAMGIRRFARALSAHPGANKVNLADLSIGIFGDY
jgi:hypothetical protein